MFTNKLHQMVAFLFGRFTIELSNAFTYLKAWVDSTLTIIVVASISGHHRDST